MGDDLGDEWEMEGVGGGDDEKSVLDSAAGMISTITSRNAAQLRMAIIHFPHRLPPPWAGRRPLTQWRPAFRGAGVGVFLVLPLSTARLLVFYALPGIVAPDMVSTDSISLLNCQHQSRLSRQVLQAHYL